MESNPRCAVHGCDLPTAGTPGVLCRDHWLFEHEFRCWLNGWRPGQFGTFDRDYARLCAGASASSA